MKMPFKLQHTLIPAVRMLQAMFKNMPLEFPDVSVPKHRRRKLNVRKMQTHPRQHRNYRQMQGDRYGQPRAV